MIGIPAPVALELEDELEEELLELKELKEEEELIEELELKELGELNELIELEELGEILELIELIELIELGEINLEGTEVLELLTAGIPKPLTEELIEVVEIGPDDPPLLPTTPASKSIFGNFSW